MAIKNSSRGIEEAVDDDDEDDEGDGEEANGEGDENGFTASSLSTKQIINH